MTRVTEPSTISSPRRLDGSEYRHSKTARTPFSRSISTCPFASKPIAFTEMNSALSFTFNASACICWRTASKLTPPSGTSIGTAFGLFNSRSTHQSQPEHATETAIVARMCFMSLRERFVGLVEPVARGELAEDALDESTDERQTKRLSAKCPHRTDDAHDHERQRRDEREDGDEREQRLERFEVFARSVEHRVEHQQHEHSGGDEAHGALHRLEHHRLRCGGAREGLAQVRRVEHQRKDERQEEAREMREPGERALIVVRLRRRRSVRRLLVGLVIHLEPLRGPNDGDGGGAIGLCAALCVTRRLAVPDDTIRVRLRCGGAAASVRPSRPSESATRGEGIFRQITLVPPLSPAVVLVA